MEPEVFAHHDLAQPIMVRGTPVQRIAMRRLAADRQEEGKAIGELSQAFVANNFWLMVASRLSGISLTSILRLPQSERDTLSALAIAAWTDAYGDRRPANVSDVGPLTEGEAAP